MPQMEERTAFHFASSALDVTFLRTTADRETLYIRRFIDELLSKHGSALSSLYSNSDGSCRK